MTLLTDLDSLLIRLLVMLEILQFQPLCPVPLVKVHKHRLFQLSLAVVDCYGIIVSVQTVNESLNRRLVDMTNIGRRLSRFLA